MALFSTVLAARQEVLGKVHVDTLKTQCNLGLALHNLKKSAEAAKVLAGALQGLEQVVGRTHPLALAAMQNLSLAIAPADPQEAVRLAREAVEGRQLAGGPKNVETL